MLRRHSDVKVVCHWSFVIEYSAALHAQMTNGNLLAAKQVFNVQFKAYFQHFVTGYILLKAYNSTALFVP
jgi:hypothetical protein